MVEGLRELISVGGPIVAILIIMSVAALTITVVKLLQFHAARVGDKSTARSALEDYLSGRKRDAIASLERSPNPASQALLRAVRGQRRGLPEAKVREEVSRYARETVSALQSWFRPLELIASLAPLLGLLGTVMGMIEAFQQLEAAGNQVNPAILSGGIWQALLTTAVGLSVAIPTIAVVSWLERKVERLMAEMESVVTRVFTEDLGADAAAEREAEFDDGSIRTERALAR